LLVEKVYTDYSELAGHTHWETEQSGRALFSFAVRGELDSRAPDPRVPAHRAWLQRSAAHA